MYAASLDIRAPQVVNDRFLQHVFSAHMPGGRIGGTIPVPSTFTGFLGYIVNCVFQFCYSTISSIVTTFFQSILGGNDASKFYHIYKFTIKF